MQWNFLNDFRGQASWGRFCALASLVIAIVQEFRGAEIAHVAMWLSSATASYTASKVTESITNRTTVQTGGEH